MAHISTLELTKEQWLEARKTSVGSSDIGAIVGINEYKTPTDLYKEKKGLVPPFEGNDATEWGTELEDFCSLMFERRELQSLYSVGAVPSIRRDNKIRLHKEHAWCAVNLDRVIVGIEYGPVILEIKTTTSFAMKFWDAVVPTSYYAQVQWQMFVSGYKKAIIWVAVLDTRQFVRLDVEYNSAFAEMLLQQAMEFHKALESNDPSNLPQYLPDIEKLCPIEGSVKEADAAIASKVDQLIDVTERISELEKSQKALKDEIKEFIAESAVLVQGERVLATYKQQHREASVTAACDFRVLRPQRKKEPKKESKKGAKK